MVGDGATGVVGDGGASVLGDGVAGGVVEPGVDVPNGEALAGASGLGIGVGTPVPPVGMAGLAVAAAIAVAEAADDGPVDALGAAEHPATNRTIPLASAI